MTSAVNGAPSSAELACDRTYRKSVEPSALDIQKSGKLVERQEKVPALLIEQGTCSVSLAYDVAQAIDLDETERRVQAAKQRDQIRHQRRAPRYFEYRPQPLRVSQAVSPFELGPFRSHSAVDLVLYDFGAVSVTYTMPLAGPLADLLALSEELYDNAALLEDSRGRVAALCQVIGPAAVKASIAEFVEDYVIYQIERFTPRVSVGELITVHAQEIAGILRAERSALSAEEVADAVSVRVSYGLQDLAVVDWNAALLLDRQGDDVRAVLEFANVELLEMRYLDDRLDRALDQSYESLSAKSWKPARLLGRHSRELRRISEFQVDSAVLFEQVNNTLKLLGDQYLARVYHMVCQRFHIGEWDSSIIRKLQTLESIYNKIADQAANRRIEVLEWIIIVLITVEILLFL